MEDEVLEVSISAEEIEPEDSLEVLFAKFEGFVSERPYLSE